MLGFRRSPAVVGGDCSDIGADDFPAVRAVDVDGCAAYLGEGGDHSRWLGGLGSGRCGGFVGGWG
jgi:hypothetical protein